LFKLCISTNLGAVTSAGTGGPHGARCRQVECRSSVTPVAFNVLRYTKINLKKWNTQLKFENAKKIEKLLTYCI